jgi:hypothetical protein
MVFNLGKQFNRYLHRQLYITGKKIILETSWLVGKDKNELGTLGIADCLTADKSLKVGPEFTRPVAELPWWNTNGRGENR